LKKIRLGVEGWCAANLENGLIPRAFNEGDGVICQAEVISKFFAYFLNSFFHFWPRFTNCLSIPDKVLAAMVGMTSYAYGTLLAAQGQMLRSTWDTAVHTSPFLTNELKAEIISV
jgi:hypothetical protein